MLGSALLPVILQLVANVSTLKPGPSRLSEIPVANVEPHCRPFAVKTADVRRCRSAVNILTARPATKQFHQFAIGHHRRRTRPKNQPHVLLWQEERAIPAYLEFAAQRYVTRAGRAP